MATVLAAKASARAGHQSSRHSKHVTILQQEFATPFAIFETSHLHAISVPEAVSYDFQSTGCLQLVRRVIARGQPELWTDGQYQLLALPIWKAENASMVAVGLFRSWPEHGEVVGSELHTPHNGEGNGISLAGYPPRCLESWAAAVVERQRLSDKLQHQERRESELDGQLKSSGKMLQVVDRLAGRLRISDRPERFQKHALTALLESLAVECVAWVPANPNEPVAVMGQCAAEEDRIRRMVQEATTDTDPRSRRCFLENRVRDTRWAIACPTVQSIAIVSADEEKPAGWLVAINKDTEHGFRSIDADLMRPVASLLNVYRKNLNLYVDLKELLFGVVRALASAIDAKDPYTRGHSERVARIAVSLGRQMMLGTDELSNLYLAGLLHDVGKIGIEDQVLKKPDKLTPAEYRHVMSHVEIGVSILRELKRLRHVLPGILHHHERFGGGGYPSGIKGEEIPLIARILAVADAFDAMSSDRPYRPGRRPSEVDQILREGANDHWDPKVVEAALACWHELTAIRQRGLGESLRVAVDDALHQDYPGTDGSQRSLLPPQRIS